MTDWLQNHPVHHQFLCCKYFAQLVGEQEKKGA
jgi:hypothetical protein